MEAINDSVDEGIRKGIWKSPPYNDSGTPIVLMPMSTMGKVRICGDYSKWVNNYLRDYSFPILQVDELMRRLNNVHYFSKIDLADASNQILLDEVSRKRLAISTHSDVYIQNRLPFRI
ncbi:Retrovirus-related Pol polyprotein [Thelohanellus kitauei]|uniref:Retrovirus-related Pol polyprotein n=1 Tax=Thelohanellus kitauei TaxID=669202 RepID=A0A0C2MUX7_THEKT|nr:Retrovirus-related Pol polyprotein [Thelohanellus kitauei]